MTDFIARVMECKGIERGGQRYKNFIHARHKLDENIVALETMQQMKTNQLFWTGLEVKVGIDFLLAGAASSY